jgi:NADPH-dependent glutamate synthase beta subunit-like oxidoreductase
MLASSGSPLLEKTFTFVNFYILLKPQYCEEAQSLGTAEMSISKGVLKEILDAEKLKYCFECGICTASCSMAEMLGKSYNPRQLLESMVLNPEKALSSDEFWLCAWCYRCYKRCPQALRIPEIFLQMRKTAIKLGLTQPFENALQKIVEEIPLPLVTLSVCFHPERAGLDKKKVLDKAEKLREKSVQSKKHNVEGRGHKIAVLGSGPAGLTVAYELSRKGYAVTVFEALPELGGMLRKCIPESRLSRQVLAKEVRFIKGLGVDIRSGVTIGKDLSFADLQKEGYKAIFVGVGAHKSQRLSIEGADLKGVVYALDFLWSANRGEAVEIGKNVVVIGGGNVAVDAARVAKALGASEVTILYRRSRDEMPAIPWEVREAEGEGVKIEFLVSPKKIVGENGKVVAIECIRMELGESDESGRRRATPIEGSEFTRKTDMVVLAIGEAPDLGFLPKDIELSNDGTLWVNPFTMETSVIGVFGGGDAVTGPATVIEAIRAGKQAAESIEKHLESLGGS